MTDATHDTHLVHRLRTLATQGRGDEARGRDLYALAILDWSVQHGLLHYSPNRKPGRWLLLLADVIGAYLGYGYERRLQRPISAFHTDLAAAGFPHVAAISERAIGHWQVAKTGPSLHAKTATLADLLTLAAVHADTSNGREKHPQARHIRKVVRTRLDPAWAEAVEQQGSDRDAPVDAANVLGALPGTYDRAERVLGCTFTRQGRQLTGTSFAVFYAHLTDARRSGRVWNPPAAYVERGEMTRARFELAAGHRLDGTRSRRTRDRRSPALTELGLSTMFPITTTLIDEWLAANAHEPLVPSSDPISAHWTSWADTNRSRIRAVHRTHIERLASR